VRLILRQAAYTIFSFLLLYGIILAITLIVSPDAEHPGELNASLASNTIYMTPPKYAFLRRDILDTPDQKVIMVGASNTEVGLESYEIQPFVPCAKVSNLAIGSANITELRQMIDLVLDVQNESARKTDTFVLGGWFGMFVDTEQLWPGRERHHGDTDIDIERYRYGFYRRTANGPVAVLPPRWLHLEVTLIRPYLALEKLVRWGTASLRSVLKDRPSPLTYAQREARVFSPNEKAAALNYWFQTMGGDRPISKAQVTLLQDTIEHLLQMGEKVVLVDLPIPAWHRDSSPYEPSYMRMVQGPLFAHFAGRPNFAALTMSDLEADQDYSDEVHPKPHLATIWAARLGAVLNPLVCGTRSEVSNTVPGKRMDTAGITMSPSGK
jgi:hypothetical protein